VAALSYSSIGSCKTCPCMLLASRNPELCCAAPL
jgi:hypothetical protein